MSQPVGTELWDFLADFVAGMDSGQNPNFLDANQLAYAGNTTSRRAFIHPRPPNRKLVLTFESEAVRLAFTKGLYQGRCYYKPDSGPEYVVASIGGRLFKVVPSGATGVVSEITGGNAQSATALQCWLWQAENYVIWNDGVSNPVFYNGTTTTRSNGTPTPPANTKYTVLKNFDIPSGYDGTKAVPDTVTFDLTTPYLGAINDHIVMGQGSVTPLYGQVTVIAGPVVTVRFDLKLQPSVNFGLASYSTGGGTAGSGFYNSNPFKVAAGTNFINLQPGATPPPIPQLPPGRMGAYGLGRIVMCLTDGKRFIYGDINGGSSGTKALDFRDAVLNVTENAFLVGGGFFSVPGSVGDIRAMLFASTLDVSLGQGPLQVFTASKVFSCAVPADRLTWQNLQNPILTESLIGNGAQGQNSTISCNSDTWFRSVDGIRSLILARREFSTGYGNTPQSREVDRILAPDAQNLLQFGSAAYFDNRLLMTVRPTATAQGVYHQALVALNFDPVSSLRGKLPMIYDGAWTGLDVMDLFTGEFSAVQRAYAFCYNVQLAEIEFWEILTSAQTELIADNGQNPILWLFESSTRFGEENRQPVERSFKRLFNGEIYVSDLKGRVDFEVYYKPDDWPCWILWHSWSECAKMDVENAQPQFRPRMGLGTPSGTPCDPSTNRPFREAFSFQFKLVISGHCTFMGAKFQATVIPKPKFAPIGCKSIC